MVEGDGNEEFMKNNYSVLTVDNFSPKQCTQKVRTIRLTVVFA